MLIDQLRDFIIDLHKANPELAKRYSGMLDTLTHIVNMREHINNILKESYL